MNSAVICFSVLLPPGSAIRPDHSREDSSRFQLYGFFPLKSSRPEFGGAIPAGWNAEESAGAPADSDSDNPRQVGEAHHQLYCMIRFVLYLSCKSATYWGTPLIEYGKEVPDAVCPGSLTLILRTHKHDHQNCLGIVETICHSSCFHLPGC